MIRYFSYMIRTLVLMLASAYAGADTAYITAGTIYTASKAGVISNGAVLVRDGKIRAVYDHQNNKPPEGARIFDVATLTPGFIDTRTTDGLSGIYNISADQDQDETADVNMAGLRALDSYNPREPLLDVVRAHGVTTLQASPGDKTPIAGQAAVFKTWGDTVEEALLVESSAMVFNLGEAVKATFGANGKAPGTRMATAAIIRQALHDAIAYADNKDSQDSINLNKLALSRVASGKLPALFSVHREDDIATALRIGREFDLDVWLHYGTEAYLAMDLIKSAGVTVLLGPTMQRLEGIEGLNASLENAAFLNQAGIPITFATGHEAYVPKSRILLFEMAVAVANGLPAEAAINAATIEAAKLLKLDKRIGSVEVGKDADLVMFDGDPFEYTSHVTMVLVNGEVAIE